ncbi:MAG: ATP-binding protein [Cyanobacteriota bacterium]
MNIRIKRFRLTHQVITVFLVAVFFPLFIAGMLLVSINQHAVKKELDYSGKVTLDNINYRLSSSVEIPTYNLKFLSNLIINQSLNLSKEEIESFMQYMTLSVPQIKSIEIYSSQNEAVLSYNPENLQTFNFLDFDSDNFVFVQRNQGVQIITLYCKVPENLLGYKVIKANLDNSTMQDVIFNEMSSIDRYVRIINNEGYVVFAYPKEKTEIDSNEIYAVPEDILKESKVGEVIPFGPFKNQPALFYKVPNSNLSIIIYTPQNVTYYGIILARQRILITLAFAAIISIFLGSIYVNALNRNFRQLIKAVNAIAEGKYERRIRLIKGYFTPYEIVYLANEFNAMAEKIRFTLKALQEANEQLAQLDKLKSNLIDTVSHELRTPLTSIRGYTSRLMRQDVEIPEDLRKKSLKVIKEQAERLSRMVEDLLVIPDLESSAIKVYMDEIDIVPIIERSIDSFKSKQHSKEITLYVPENLPTIFLDPDRFEQVIVNLIGNAVKYSYPNSPIIVNIDVFEEENKLVLEVINECDPIQNELLQTLFEKFKRLDDNLTRTTRGSGLGLFISKGLIETMGGSIRLEYKEKFKAIIELPL